MKLAIFDIDGTLAATSKVDADCYVQAVQEVLNILIDDSDWSNFRNYTDSGILAEVFENAHNLKIDAGSAAAVESRFIELLEDKKVQAPELFNEVTGAVAMLNSLQEKSDWRVSFATGCWRKSAELKLSQIGIEPEKLALATCDKFYGREEIMLDAGFAFVGLEHGNHHKKLSNEGVSHILTGYQSFEEVLAAIEEARKPT